MVEPPRGSQPLNSLRDGDEDYVQVADSKRTRFAFVLAKDVAFSVSKAGGGAVEGEMKSKKESAI